MPVKATYKKKKKVSVMEGIEQYRREQAEAEAKKPPVFPKFDPHYADESLVPELRATRPPKEIRSTDEDLWAQTAPLPRGKKRRKGSGGKLKKLELGATGGASMFSATAPYMSEDGRIGSREGELDVGGSRGGDGGGAGGPGEGLPDSETLRDLTVGLRPVEPGTTLAKEQRKAVGNKDWGPSIFERDSPRARATLRTFLCDFLVDDARGNVRIRKDIDLRSYAKEAMRPVTNATVQEICVMQPAMTSLDISGCDLVTDAALWAVSRHCPELRSMVACGCSQITRIGLRAMTLGCHGVQRLELSRCKNLDDPALSAIAAGFPNLTSLTVKECGNITDDGLAVLASGCRDLEHVDVSGCPRVGEFGDRALLALGRFCSKLTKLDMFGCAHVQDAGIIAVARGCSGLAQLRLTGCRELTGGALAALARKCTGLVDLSIAGCERVRDTDLCRLVGQTGAVDMTGRNGMAGRAQMFGQGHRHYIGELDTLKKAAKGVDSLTRLDVSACHDVRARGLQAIAERCTELRELTLKGCASVGDDSCVALANHGHRLRHLDLTDCPLVTEKGVAAIARHATRVGNG